MNDEYVSIFMETSEDLGILYRSYKPVLTHLNHFISTIEKCVKMLNDDPDHVDIDLGAAIKKFKADIDFEKSPDPIKTGSINDTTKKLKEFKNDLEKSLSRYIKLKSSTKYGGTALSAIVTRPRVYSKDIDEEKYDKINKNIRNVNRALDWIEKCIIDLYNFVDQDLNLLNIVNRVYVKNKIYENALPGGVEEDVATSVIGMLPNATGEAVGVKGVLNTRDKRTGTAPGYIANNHDMAKYGEEDGEEKKDDDNKEVTLDDYKRPSAEEDKKDEPVEFDPNLVQDGGSEPSPFNDTKDDNSSNNSRSSSGVNNYYYYTYNNSLNRHSHSNIDKSVHDDHSDHSYHDDHSSRKYVTDHSVKNEIKDEDHPHNGYDSHDPRKKDDGFKQLESAWTLNLGVDEVYTEAAQTSEGKAEYDALCEKIGRKPNQKELTPPESITLVFDSGNEAEEAASYKKMDFTRFSVFAFDDNGNYLKDEKSFEEVPAAIYGLNSIKESDNTINCKFGINIQDTLQNEYIKKICGYDHVDCSDNIIENLDKFEFKPKYICFKHGGLVGIAFDTSLDEEHGCGIEINTATLEVSKIGDETAAFESVITEAVGDADDMKPKSDHPVKDALMDVDRATTRVQQGAKRGVQNISNVGRAAMKPVNRTKQWIGNMISNWKDKDETEIKEQMADPHARSALFTAIKRSIEIGALAQAGLLLNPIFLCLGGVWLHGRNKQKFRLRNEMIGELKTELKVIDEKIQDADRNGDNKAKYQLMRFKNEINKKLLRVGGSKGWSKII